MQKTEVRTIEDLEFRVTQLPAMRAMKLLHRIGKAVGPALAKIADSAPAGGDIFEGGDLSGAVELLFDRLPEADLEGIVRALLETAIVKIEGKSCPLMDVFDVVLAGRLEILPPLVLFAMEVNYGSFLGVLGGGLRSLRGAVPPLPSPTT